MLPHHSRAYLNEAPVLTTLVRHLVAVEWVVVEASGAESLGVEVVCGVCGIARAR